MRVKPLGSVTDKTFRKTSAKKAAITNFASIMHAPFDLTPTPHPLATPGLPSVNFHLPPHHGAGKYHYSPLTEMLEVMHSVVEN